MQDRGPLAEVRKLRRDDLNSPSPNERVVESEIRQSSLESV